MTHRNVVAMQHAESGVGAALHLEIVENVVAAIVNAEHVIPRAKEATINNLSRMRCEARGVRTGRAWPGAFVTVMGEAAEPDAAKLKGEGGVCVPGSR